MYTPYRDELEASVARHLTRKLGKTISNFKPYDPLYRVIKADIRKILFS